MMFDMISVGEILVDLVDEGGMKFSGTVGGAPCNALAQAAKMGSKTAFVGMVGNDAFGRACARQLDELGIDRQYLYVTKEADTTLAFVSLDEKGERDFSFYRRPGADSLLTVKNIPFDAIAQSRVYLFGGVALSKDPTMAAVFYSLFKMSGEKVIKAFDPNLRPALWESLEDAKALGRKAMGLCDVMKLSEEEAVFFSGLENPVEGAKALQKAHEIPLVLLTAGEKGCSVLFGGDLCHLDACKVDAVDSTAAGDSFFGAFLHGLLQNDFEKIEELFPAQILSAVGLAQAAAAITVTRKGSIPALPTAEEVAAFLK